MDILSEIKKRLLTQDNHITAEPIFMVQRRKRIYGFDPAYDGDGEAWYHCDGFEAEGKDLEEINALLAKGEKPPEEWTLFCYIDIWENIQPFFTHVGAEEWMRRNLHNLGIARIYVGSAHNNWEWKTARALLAGKEATPCTTP